MKLKQENDQSQNSSIYENLSVSKVCSCKPAVKSNINTSAYVTQRVTFGPNAQMTLLSKMTSK